METIQIKHGGSWMEGIEIVIVVTAEPLLQLVNNNFVSKITETESHSTVI